MPKINPSNLRKLRERKNLTLNELGENARVDRATISKIENGKRTECRPSTLRKLAGALGVEPGSLTGPDVGDADDAPSFFARKSQLNFKMADDARNALNLVAMRYDVKPAQILHLAPFLFYWAAEASLRWRQERVDAIDAQLEALNGLPLPKHLSGVVIDNWRGDEVLDEERRSIAARDLFGLSLSDEMLWIDYEPSEHNPMVQFLKSVAATLGGTVEFEYWTPRWDHLAYAVGRCEALAFVGGNEEAADHIMHGRARLHEIPKEVRDQGSQAVADWVIEQGDLTAEEFEKDILGLIGGDNA